MLCIVRRHTNVASMVCPSGVATKRPHPFESPTTVRNMEAERSEEPSSTHSPLVLDAAAFEYTQLKQGARFAVDC